MTKWLFAGAALALILTAHAATASAQSGKLAAGGEFGLVVPTGDWADVTGVGFGLFGRVDYAVAPKIAVTGVAGYAAHLATELDLGFATVDASTSELVFAGGARFYVVPTVELHALTGLNIWTFKAEAAGESDSESETRVPLILGGAFEAASGLTVGGDLFIPNLFGTEDEEDVQVGILFKVGYLVSL